MSLHSAQANSSALRSSWLLPRPLLTVGRAQHPRARGSPTPLASAGEHHHASSVDGLCRGAKPGGLPRCPSDPDAGRAWSVHLQLAAESLGSQVGQCPPCRDLTRTPTGPTTLVFGAASSSPGWLLLRTHCRPTPTRPWAGSGFANRVKGPYQSQTEMTTQHPPVAGGSWRDAKAGWGPAA